MVWWFLACIIGKPFQTIRHCNLTLYDSPSSIRHATQRRNTMKSARASAEGTKYLAALRRFRMVRVTLWSGALMSEVYR